MEVTERPKRKGIMLAVPADEKKVANFPTLFLIQPKLNGERGIVINFTGEPIILSSYQNPFTSLDKITKAISSIWELYQKPILFDGEIYKHGWEREKIDSALRSTVTYNSDVEELEFHIFDINIPAPQITRLTILNQIFSQITSSILKLVPTYQANKNTWMEQADIFLQQGYEGAILRNPNFPTYQPRRMVSQMLKYKPTETDEYTITGVKEAISKHGDPLSMVGAFTVMGDDKVEFDVGAGKLTHQERKHYWYTQSTLPGCILVTKQGKIKTSHGLPTCTVALEVKEKS